MTATTPSPPAAGATPMFQGSTRSGLGNTGRFRVLLQRKIDGSRSLKTISASSTTTTRRILVTDWVLRSSRILLTTSTDPCMSSAPGSRGGHPRGPAFATRLVWVTRFRRALTGGRKVPWLRLKIREAAGVVGHFQPSKLWRA
ncbi:uncharacterized protein LOC125575369 [Brassica napus]|uniref:uncharacterized protein LOC125575369 n=1 Tax=Brassica napus TaxID=3708 RepID=UPI002078BAFE|nr:uncharacterized protein LOC125575369 [Brassica napus]